MSDASDAAAKAAQMYYAVYDEGRRNLAPYREAGANTMPYYGGILGIPGYQKVNPTEAIRSTPGYNFLMDQGVNAIDRSAAAKGMLGSGAVAKGLQTFGQGLADQSYNNYMNRLYGLITGGQNASVQTGNLGMQFAQGAGNALMDAAKTDSLLEAQQNRGNSLFSSIMGGAGLLGGALLSPMPQGGFKNTIGGGLYNWIRG